MIQARKIEAAIFLTILVTLPVYGSASACSESVRKDRVAEHEEDRKLYSFVEDYIAETKGWLGSNYYIELNRRQGNVLVFWVIHDEDKANATPGAGKSIEVHVDRDEMKVVKEVAFQ